MIWKLSLRIFFGFTDHPSIRKQSLSDILHRQHHSILPKGNLLPDSYLKAMKIVEHYLVKLIIYEVCPNDCIIFRGNFSELRKCPKCNANRYKSKESKCVPVRTFHYLPIGPRLRRLFATSNLAELVQEHGGVSPSSILFDLHDSSLWKLAYSNSGVFEGDNRGILFSLCTDGVNPFSHLRCNYSMWPIVFIFQKIFVMYFSMFLVGIITENGKKEAKNIHPYLEVLVDELLSLTNAKMYDSYRQADFKLKSEILFYVLDYPGVGKVFNVHGAGSLMV